MNVQQQKINEGNEKIARLLGWYQEEPSIAGTWFEKTDVAIVVAYSIQNNYPHQDLPFHRDWNWMMKAIEKLEDLGACIIISNYCKTKSVKNELAAHIGYALTADYFCDMAGSLEENEETRYFQIQNIGVDKKLNTWNTIINFIDFYNDKSIRVINMSDGKIDRVEHNS